MAYTTSSFKTRARTIDHLGREQIADCPTAISELWKNSYDAYATEVSLHLFDGEVDVAALFDNGHGMCRDEFETKWLTVGTESKTDKSVTPIEDRNGLDIRPKHGQKGIGRLSSAALGPLLLLISKRKNSKYVASLIDWRIFENPYLYLDDIRIPISEFEAFSHVLEELPQMFDVLMGNVWGDSDSEERNSRLLSAWEQFSVIEIEKGIPEEETTKNKIESTLIKDVFTERHFNKSRLFRSDSNVGTEMFMAVLQDDLKAQLSKAQRDELDDTEATYRENFFQTLSNFTDPYESAKAQVEKKFHYSVTVWHGDVPRTILDQDRQFNLNNLNELEHILEGEVDAEGYFRGRVKVFGEWFEDYVIKPRQVYKTRKDSAFGPFSIKIGTFEMQKGSTSLSDEQHASFSEMAELYSGLRVYRDGLRVMPYGRTDNDYFNIEYRRSKHAGRYFWANRRLFGRVAITGESNPNLKDKAGREGFIENRASKLFKEIVEKILIDSSRDYFGTVSDIRKPTLEAIQEEKKKAKAEEDKKKLLSRERKRIRSSINNNFNALVNFVDELKVRISAISEQNRIGDIDDLNRLKSNVDGLIDKSKSFSLSPVPPNLGRLEDDYRNYRKYEQEAKNLVQYLNDTVNRLISESKTISDYEKASEVYRSKLASINSSITRQAGKAKELLSKQQLEIEKLVKHCREQYKSAVEEHLEDLRLEKVSFDRVMTVLDEEQYKVELDNQQKLVPYVTAIESINDQIDLEGLAVHSMNEEFRVREELARIHSLAQLGITVEIIGHELEALDSRVDAGLTTLIDGLKSKEQLDIAQKVYEAHSELTEKINFLSPLKLSGDKSYRKITGLDIHDFIIGYFNRKIEDKNIKIFATEKFKKVSIYDLASRVYPVFINLINNSIYWLRNEDKKEILIDLVDNVVVVSDSGPGVDADDIPMLFSLFFSRKQRGGRGVGLYLSRQNLRSSGHMINYASDKKYKLLKGANFIIEFKGIDYD
ncbi:ATP-binding protein [Vibrio alginolyticus]|uniref:ATP-binding protein n=2 Tax=Vibrio alginolyticus TaxID=663 RepID=UPI00215C59A8|nr:ATP-binding protein [Vibrio alginolyticus]MCR9541462.1 ATP-binding protein [Vibrio alginolyticus]